MIHTRQKLFISFNFVLLLLFCFHSAQATENHIQAKIFNPNSPSTTNTQQWPWVVALVFKGRTILKCGGTLIAKKWVLTAAHCIYDRRTGLMNQNDIEVLVNSSTLDSSEGERMAVDEITVHPAYPASISKNILDYDIALVKLKNDADLSPIETISEFSDQDKAGKESIALGWGLTYRDTKVSKTSNYLNYVVLPVVSNTSCKTKYSKINADMLCAGYEDPGKGDTCSGDSGGPLVTFDNSSGKWRQIGITSYGDAYCGTNFGTYGVYTRLKSYKGIIASKICTPEEIPANPYLQVAVSDTFVNLTWTASGLNTQYQIIYQAPDDATPHSFDIGSASDFAIELPHGSAYDVWVRAHQGNCISQYSNLGKVIVP